MEAHDQTNTVRLTEADAQVAEALDIEAGSPVNERARLIKDAGNPTHRLTSYCRPEQATPGVAVLTIRVSSRIT